MASSLWDKIKHGTQDVLTGGSWTKGHNIRESANRQLAGTREAEGYLTPAYEESKGYQQPYYDTGREATDMYMQGLRSGEYDPGEFNPEKWSGQVDLSQDPGYQFRMQQGNQAMLSSLAKGAGGAYSPDAMRQMMSYNQGLGSQEFDAARKRSVQDYAMRYGREQDIYNTGRQRLMDRAQRLQNMSSQGQAAANNLSTLTTGYGADRANLAMQRGNIESQKKMSLGNLNPFGQFLQTAGTVAGGVIGGMTGGPAGAMAGANMGRQVGGGIGGVNNSGSGGYSGQGLPTDWNFLGGSSSGGSQVPNFSQQMEAYQPQQSYSNNSAGIDMYSNAMRNANLLGY